MDAKLPSLNYAVLKAAHDELDRAALRMFDAGGGSSVSNDDARTLGICSQGAKQAAEALFDFLNVLSSHADSAGAAEAIRGKE